MIFDEFSMFKMVNILRGKSEVLEKFQEFLAEHDIPHVSRSVNNEEFTSKHFERFCIENKIKLEFTVPEILEKNEMSAWANRKIVEMAKYLLLQAKIPKTHSLRTFATASFFEKPC